MNLRGLSRLATACQASSKYEATLPTLLKKPPFHFSWPGILLENLKQQLGEAVTETCNAVLSGLN